MFLKRNGTIQEFPLTRERDRAGGNNPISFTHIKFSENSTCLTIRHSGAYLREHMCEVHRIDSARMFAGICERRTFLKDVIPKINR